MVVRKEVQSKLVILLRHKFESCILSMWVWATKPASGLSLSPAFSLVQLCGSVLKVPETGGNYRLGVLWEVVLKRTPTTTLGAGNFKEMKMSEKTIFYVM